MCKYINLLRDITTYVNIYVDTEPSEYLEYKSYIKGP